MEGQEKQEARFGPSTKALEAGSVFEVQQIGKPELGNVRARRPQPGGQRGRS